VARTEPERFWDERARENALFYVDDQVDYRAPDTEAFWRRGDETLEKILSPLEQTVSPQDTVVDIGCGVGRMTRALASRAARVIALDVSQEMLARARELNAQVQNVEWIHGDGRTLTPIGDGAVDGCFSHVVFQHLPNPEMTLGYVREMGRVLRPGGWAAFVVSTDPTIHRLSLLDRTRARWRAVTRRPVEARYHSAWLGSAVDPEALRRAARDAKCDVERIVYPGTQFTLVLCRRQD